MQKISTRSLVLYALFAGIIFLLGLTPLGFITLPIAAITTVHIPVIIGAYRFGIKGGTLLGFFFGLTSLIACFTRPDAIAAIVLGTKSGFAAYNLFLILTILFIPRLCVGMFSALVYKALHKKNETIAMGAAAFLGSLTNTVFVLGGLYLFAFEETGAILGFSAGFTSEQVIKVLLGIVSLNGLLEAAFAVLICTAVGRALLHFEKREAD